MNLIDALTSILVVAGAVFFLAGTVGLLRLPDVFTRLHALTKADNLGLGLVVVGVSLQMDAWQDAFKLIGIWFLVLVSSATVAHLIGRYALLHGYKPWEKEE
ncbi:MAG: monovalent cation/H(+) antiporter subunit G [Anaerolineaceae bacterium]|nr:MAG: monovalent cation/H(+) antiporter subunit G [Anaerolineaceae bacterium]